MPKVHFQSIRQLRARTITVTLCNRIIANGVDATELRHEVTCKFCLRLLMGSKQERAA